jgi:UDP-N-acetyl-D-glucosamine dehydrogenase
MRRWGDIGKKSVPLTPRTLGSYDCILIATHHSAINWQQVADESQLIVDTRGAMRDVKGKRDHIVLA